MSSAISVSQASTEVNLAINCTNKDCPGWLVHESIIPKHKQLNCHFACTKAHVTQTQKTKGYLPLKCDFGWGCKNPDCCRAHYGDEGPNVKICVLWFRTNKCSNEDCQYAHPEHFYKAPKPQPKVQSVKKIQELSDEEFKEMANQNDDTVVEKVESKVDKKKVGGSFAALDVVENDTDSSDNEDDELEPEPEDVQRFQMVTPVNAQVEIPEVSPTIILSKKNYKTLCPTFATYSWEQVEALAKQIGATTVEEKTEPIRVVKPKAVVEEFPTLGSAPVKKHSTGQWGNQDANTRNAKWNEIAKEKAAREAEEKKEAEEKARRTKEALLAKAKAEQKAAIEYANGILDSDDEDEQEATPEIEPSNHHEWWN